MVWSTVKRAYEGHLFQCGHKVLPSRYMDGYSVDEQLMDMNGNI
jgi:hypothetical protein